MMMMVMVAKGNAHSHYDPTQEVVKSCMEKGM
jgi:hypothetical protein